jgi:hypothetical protein
MLTYALANGETGTATITLHAHDDGGTANGGVDDSADETFTITVDSPNVAPTANATSASGNEDGGPITVALSGDDANGDALTFSAGSATNGVVSAPANVTCNALTPSHCTATVTYTPDADFNGTDSFTYTVNDGELDSASATATITVDGANDAPVGGDDAFTGVNGALGNTRLVVGTTTTGPHLAVAGGVLANDTDIDTPSGLTAIAATISSANCAACNNVALNSNGTFTYDPPAGFTGTDTFTYTVNDNDSEAPANRTDTATVSIEVVGPLVWYVDIDAAAPPAGQGGRSHSPFNSLAPLNSGGAADALDGNGDIIFVGVDTAPATGPYTGGIVLETNQKLWGEPFGLTVDPNGPIPATQLAAPTATSVANNPNIRGNGAGSIGITLANGVDVQRVNADTTGSNTIGISGTSVTTATIGPNQLIQGNATGLSLTGAAGGNITVGATISGNNGTEVNVANRTSGTVTISGDITGTAAGNAIALANNTGGTIDFTGAINLSNGGAGVTVFSASGGGTVTASHSSNQITAFAGTGVNLNGVNIGAAGVAFNTISSGAAAANGVLLTNVGGAGSFSLSNGAITATTRGLDVDGGTNNVTINASLATSGAASRSVEVTNRSGGTVDVNGLVTENSTGINLSTNGAGLVRFDGGLIGSTGANTAFSVTGSGSVVVTDPTPLQTAPDNTLTTTTGTALNVQNTTIGADGLNFRTISANGAPNGIVLSNTGTTAGLTVTGTGTAGSGGTIQNTTGRGASFTDTRSISLASMNFAGNAGGGIVADAFDAGTMNVTLTNNSISVANGLAADGISLNAGAGSINALVTGNAITYAGTQRAVLAQTGQDGAGALNLTMTGNSVNIQLDGAGDAVAGMLAQSGVTSPTGDGSSLCADIGGAGGLANTFTHSLGGAIAGGDIRVRQRNNGTVRLPGYAGGATDTAAVASYLAGRNTVVSAPTATADSTGFAGAAACTLPSP